MKGIKLLLLSGYLLSVILLLSGCWNYREIENLAIVSGIAVDKKDYKYIVTTEIVDIKGGRDQKVDTIHLTTEGNSIFEAVRNGIKLAGKKLFFSHAETVIISKEIAEDGIVPVIDWFGRDAEPRYTLHLLISREGSAKEILEQRPLTKDILAYELNDILTAQDNLSYAMNNEEWQFLRDLIGKGISATLPTVDLTVDHNRLTPEVAGTGIFKKDKLVGFLSGEETKTMLFIKNQIKGGLLTKKECKDSSPTNISLEIFKNKTNVKPRYVNGKIAIDITTDTDVAIAENGGQENYIDEEGRVKLKEDFETMLENDIKDLVKKVQSQYGSDIFGFGEKIGISIPRLWKKIEPKWEQEFKKVNVEVHSTINIKNSGLESKPIKVGD